jgi:hypothetical protein
MTFHYCAPAPSVAESAGFVGSEAQPSVAVEIAPKIVAAVTRRALTADPLGTWCLRTSVGPCSDHHEYGSACLEIASHGASVPEPQSRIVLARGVGRGNNSHLSVTMRLAELPLQTTEPAVLQGLPERMMGLEPSTFCMATRPDPPILVQEPHG